MTRRSWYVEQPARGAFARLSRVDAVIRRALTYWADSPAEVNIRHDGRHVATLTSGGFWRTSDAAFSAAIEKYGDAL